MRVFINGTQVPVGGAEPEAGASNATLRGSKIGAGGLAGPGGMPSRGIGRGPGGSTALVDIHYHGSSALEDSQRITQPGRGSGVALPKGGTAALLDIHYHGSSAIDDGQLGGTIGAIDKTVMPGLGGQVGLPGGTAALLDIHYHGSSALDGISPESAQQEEPLPGSIHIYGS